MADACSRYLNTGLRRAELLFESAHERAAQYLDQAPVLVMWALPWSDFSDDGGETFARAWIAAKCADGVGLKEMLRAASYTAPMRGLHRSVIRPGHASLYRMLARVPTAVLGRSIPTTAKAQRAWLGALGKWLSAGRSRSPQRLDIDAAFAWCVERFSGADLSRVDPADIMDFQCGGPAFNLAWGLKRAVEEMGIWHTRITLASQLRGLPVGADDVIDYSDQPDSWSCERLAFTALRTPRQIAEEGSAMRHCVATYISRVFNGQSHIASITEDGKRVATLELAGPKMGAARWSVRQIKGPRNSPVKPHVEALGAVYAQLMRERALAQAIDRRQGKA